VLNNPAALLEKEVNLLPSPLFWGHGWARAAGLGTENARRILRNRSLEARNLIGICDGV
jgi:hypothetical protein